jgi:hypothetical protein
MGGSTLSLPPPVFEPGLPIQVRYVHLPPDGVALIIATDDDPENVLVPPAQPVSPPLSLDDFNPGQCHGRRADVLVPLGSRWAATHSLPRSRQAQEPIRHRSQHLWNRSARPNRPDQGCTRRILFRRPRCAGEVLPAEGGRS